MARIPTNQKDSLGDKLEQMNQRIARRAYELFQGREGQGDSVGDWLSAERELVEKPAVELREEEGALTVVAALPGIDAKDITIDITPRDVLIQASEYRHAEDAAEIPRSVYTEREVFSSLQFPTAVDAANAKAVYQNGILNITVPVAPDMPADQIEPWLRRTGTG